MVIKDLNIYLTPTQIKKYREKGELNLTNNIFLKSPNYSLRLDSKIYNEINKLKNSDKKYKIINSQQMVGGFLPIIPILAGLAAATTIGKNIYEAVENKKTNEILKGSAISLSNKKILR